MDFADWLTDEKRWFLYRRNSCHKPPTRCEQDLNLHRIWVQALLKLCSRDNHYTTAAFTLNTNFRDFIETSVEHFLDIRKNPFWWENYGKEFRRYIQKIWFDKTSRDTFGRFCYVICGSRYFASKITISCREFHPF